jgi:2-aminoethylphosphonate-pyruvate transaminase
VKILERQNKPYYAVTGSWLSSLDIDKIGDIIRKEPKVTRLAIVHHETTTGRLNDLDAIADLCSNRGVGLMIDCVSSFGGEDISLSRWRPLAIAAAANKCLHAAPGVSFVLAKRAELSRSNNYSPSVYLDLETYYRQQMYGWSPFTQAVHLFYALNEALCELVDTGGWRIRRAQYHALSLEIGASLASYNIQQLLPIMEKSVVLTAYRLPSQYTYDTLHSALKSRGYIIYSGQGFLVDKIFRIAHMGAIQPADLQNLKSTFDIIFTSPDKTGATSGEFHG